MDSNWDLKAVVLIQVSYHQYTELQSLESRASELQELQSFRASNRGTKIQNTVKHCKTPQNTAFRHALPNLVMGNRSKDENAAASNSTKDRDQESNSRDQDIRDTSLSKAIAEAVAQQTQAIADVFQRQMEETRAQYEELFKASRAQNFTSTLKVTSSTDGFRVMDPFDWTADKNIYQRWQLWSHKARLALNAMEGHSDTAKISYIHHWLDGKGISNIQGWMNSKILISQEEYNALE